MRTTPRRADSTEARGRWTEPIQMGQGDVLAHRVHMTSSLTTRRAGIALIGTMPATKGHPMRLAAAGERVRRAATTGLVVVGIVLASIVGLNAWADAAATQDIAGTAAQHTVDDPSN
jgi:hypothetical protein